MQLIIHADDFGISKRVNEGIIQAHTDGVLTSTSIIANGAAFEHAVNLLKTHSSLDVGIHLTLIEERPLLSPEVVPSLVMENGRFHKHAKYFFQKYIAGKISLDEIRLEFTEQIEKVLNTGIAISHIDSHQHIHILPKIFELITELAQKYGIRSIRIPNEKLRLYMFKHVAAYPRILQLLIVKTILTGVNKKRVSSTPRFNGFYYGGKLNKQNLTVVIDNLPKKGVCELVCHPGMNDSNSDYAHWQYSWQDELDAVTDPDIRSLIQHKRISLISYRDLIIK